MQKLMLCACVLVSIAVMTSARPSDNEQILEALLERLLEKEEKELGAKTCDKVECHTGKCDCDETCYCWKCSGPNKDKTNGGKHCELPDPCGQNSGSNPCSGKESRCKPSSMEKIGYYCLTPTRSFLDEMLDHLEEDADQEEYRQARLMLARSGSPGEGLAKAVRDLLD